MTSSTAHKAASNGTDHRAEPASASTASAGSASEECTA